MSNFTITVQDTEVTALLQRLRNAVGNMQPIMQDIGEGIMERTKQRFVTSTAPDGGKWLPNAKSTYSTLAHRLGKSSLTKDGKVNGKGATNLSNKKPLIGESKSLMREFHVSANSNSVTVGNSMIYAAIHQFGGQAGRRGKVTIPARPFLPITKNQELYDVERQIVAGELSGFLKRLLEK